MPKDLIIADPTFRYLISIWYILLSFSPLGKCLCSLHAFCRQAIEAGPIVTEHGGYKERDKDNRRILV